MKIHDPADSPAILYDLSGPVKQDMNIPANFPLHSSELPFQQIINNNDQNQASTSFMLLHGDSPHENSDFSALHNQQSTTNNVEMMRPPVKKKRCQVRNACVNCQKSNKKCEEVRPCSRCIKNHLVDSCTNSKRKKRQKGIKRGPYKRRKKMLMENNPIAAAMNSMVPILETPVAANMDSLIDFTGQPFFEYDSFPRLFMQSLPAPSLDSIPSYPVMSSFEDNHTSSEAAIDSAIQCPAKAQENPLEMMSTLLDDTLIKNFNGHVLDNRVDPSCRPLSLGHEADLGTLASLCAAVLGED